MRQRTGLTYQIKHKSKPDWGLLFKACVLYLRESHSYSLLLLTHVAWRAFYKEIYFHNQNFSINNALLDMKTLFLSFFSFCWICRNFSSHKFYLTYLIFLQFNWTFSCLPSSKFQNKTPYLIQQVTNSNRRLFLSWEGQKEGRYIDSSAHVSGSLK